MQKYRTQTMQKRKPEGNSDCNNICLMIICSRHSLSLMYTAFSAFFKNPTSHPFLSYLLWLSWPTPPSDSHPLSAMDVLYCSHNVRSSCLYVVFISVSSTWLWSHSGGRPESCSDGLWKQRRRWQVLHHEEILLAFNHLWGMKYKV